MPENEPSEQTKLSSAELLASIEARFEVRLQAKRERETATPAQAILPVAKPAERSDGHRDAPLEISVEDLPPEGAPAPPAQGEPLVVTHEDLDDAQPEGELAPAPPPPDPAAPASADTPPGNDTAPFPADVEHEKAATITEPPHTDIDTPDVVGKNATPVSIVPYRATPTVSGGKTLPVTEHWDIRISPSRPPRNQEPRIAEEKPESLDQEMLRKKKILDTELERNPKLRQRFDWDLRDLAVDYYIAHQLVIQLQNKTISPSDRARTDRSLVEKAGTIIARIDHILEQIRGK